jgi:hypothetical protein
MLADPDEVDTEFVGQHRLVDDVADHLGMRQRRTVRSAGDVAKRVQSKFERCRHVACFGWPICLVPSTGAI